MNVTPREITTNPRKSDKVFRSIVSIVGLVAFAVLLLIGTFLALRGFQIFKIEGFKFLTSSDWNVVTGTNNQTFWIGQEITVVAQGTGTGIGRPIYVVQATF